MNENELNTLKEKYARLIVQKGLNFIKGSEVEIEADTDQLEFVNLLMEEAYKFGASKVRANLTYRPLLNTMMKYEDKESQIKLEKYEKEKIKHHINNKVAFIYIESFDPDWVETSLEETFLYVNTFKNKNIKNIGKGKKRNGPFTIVAAPSKNWSKKLFPNLSEEEAINKHWETIFKCVHISLDEDPLISWDKHVNKIREHSTYLNSLNIKSLHYKNSLGTDLIIGLIPNTYYADAADYDESNGHRVFYSNMPTEEVFNSPDKSKTEGIVYSSKPLCLDGIMIEDFSFRFHKGKVVEVHAKKGENILKTLIKSDKGASYLGEAALVPFNSPINQTGLIFKNILFDENACCHFALGDAYTYTLKNHTQYKKKDFIKMGFNNSTIHVDFMIGTSDLEIIATTYDNKEVTIFKNGVFVK